VQARPGSTDIEVGYFEGWWSAVLVFIIGPEGGNEAYIPTIDGAWFCPNFDWTPGYV
jgi:predicted methyltransferase